MDFQKEISDIFNSYDPNNFDPSGFLQECMIFLDSVCGVGNEYDPRVIDGAANACNAYGYVSNLFLQHSFSSAAISILVTAWNKFSSIQRSEKQRIYHAGIGMYLARAYLSLGDKGAALRWALLTQADDLLGEHPEGGGAGRQTLDTILGMSNKALSELARVAEQNLGQVRDVSNNDWSIPYAFAEDVIARFAFNYPEFSQLFAAPSEVVEFSLNDAYFESLLDRVNTAAANAKEKGDWLEDLGVYLFLLIPGLVPRRNLLEETLAFETDIVIRNLVPTRNVVADLLGRHFLVECKNWESTVGVKDIGYFLYRMRLTHASFGVMMAKSGITGDEEKERAAYSLIRKAFHEDGNVCIVIDNASLVSLLSDKLSFWSMLLERIERMRFGRPRSKTTAAMS
jgi:hypothetical protein